MFLTIFIVSSFHLTLAQNADSSSKDECAIYMPEMIGPHDETNDRWIVRTNCAVVEFHFTLCDRWGKVIYTQESIGKGYTIEWDFNKVGDPNGTIYCWKLNCKLKSKNGIEEKAMKGKVRLVK